MISHHFPFKPAFLFFVLPYTWMEHQAGITAFLITLLYPQHPVKIITKVQTFIELAFLPFPRLSLGSMRWWREGLIFCHTFLPSLLLTPTLPHTKLYLAPGGRKVFFAWKSWNLVLWCQGGTCSKSQFIFLGVFWGFLGAPHRVDLHWHRQCLLWLSASWLI